MMFRFRHGIIGPVAIFWLTITIASTAMATMAWSRLSRSVDVWAKADQLRESLNQLFSALQNAEASQRGFLLKAC
jgi:CHASE3 domain sensor protein